AVEESEGIRQIRDRIRCGQCGATMLRHINSKRAIRESWTCSNADCGHSGADQRRQLLRKITLLMNRVIANADLMLPHPKIKHRDSAVVLNLQQQISDEMEQGRPR
ncbi:MAG: zinc ribbon domain-containing protein, partial [Oscillospiraceae bacterium]